MAQAIATGKNHSYLEILLVGVEHAVEPRQELLGAVVAVQDDGHAVVLGHEADVVGARHRTEDCRLLTLIRNTLEFQSKGLNLAPMKIIVLQYLASVEGCTTI